MELFFCLENDPSSPVVCLSLEGIGEATFEDYTGMVGRKEREKKEKQRAPITAKLSILFFLSNPPFFLFFFGGKNLTTVAFFHSLADQIRNPISCR